MNGMASTSKMPFLEKGKRFVQRSYLASSCEKPRAGSLSQVKASQAFTS
jgi:hypothetical protein